MSRMREAGDSKVNREAETEWSLGTGNHVVSLEFLSFSSLTGFASFTHSLGSFTPFIHSPRSRTGSVRPEGPFHGRTGPAARSEGNE